MLAEDLDFRAIFKISQTAMALLDANLVFIDVNDQFIETSGRDLGELVGRRFREVFPRRPEDRGTDLNWGAIEKAVTSGRREADELLRYDVEDPKTGLFEERYFSSRVQPIRGRDGHVEVYELSVLEVTGIVAEIQAWLVNAPAL
jgi:PAS domain S-box-containing protein